MAMTMMLNVVTCTTGVLLVVDFAACLTHARRLLLLRPLMPATSRPALGLHQQVLVAGI